MSTEDLSPERIAENLRHEIEQAHREIDCWWPTVVQRPLYMRIRQIHELEDGRVKGAPVEEEPQ